MLKLENLSVEHQINPIGIDCEKPRFGWVLLNDMRDTVQTAYRIIVTSENGDKVDTGKIFSEDSIEVIVKKLKVEPKTRYEVSVTVWDNHGNIASSIVGFETGFLGEEWKSEWLYRELGGIQSKLPGYKKITIKPALDCGLESVHASQYTPYGKVVVDWKKSGANVNVKLQIPANTTAEVVLPNMLKAIGSGTYEYQVTM